MACSGCDARRAWLARKAKLAAQALAALTRQQMQQPTDKAVAIVAKDLPDLPMSITKDGDK